MLEHYSALPQPSVPPHELGAERGGTERGAGGDGGACDPTQYPVCEYDPEIAEAALWAITNMACDLGLAKVMTRARLAWLNLTLHHTIYLITTLLTCSISLTRRFIYNHLTFTFSPHQPTQHPNVVIPLQRQSRLCLGLASGWHRSVRRRRWWFEPTSTLW